MGKAKSAVVVGALLLATMAAAGAHAMTTADPCLSAGGQLPGNVIALNAEHGFRPYLAGAGVPFVKLPVPSPAQLGAGRLCGSAPVVTAAVAARAAQTRFFVLYRAFPARPSKAQWRARFRPLAFAAATADRAFLTLLNVEARDEVAAKLAAGHCGQPPNPPNLCDNQTVPPSLTDALANAKTTLDAIAADRTWLVKEARLPWPSR